MYEQNILDGVPFIFNNIPSEIYGLSMVYVDKNSYEYSSGSGMNFITEQITKNPELIFLGASQFPVLTFDIDIISRKPMDIFELSRIKDWFVSSGYDGYKKLQICTNNLDQYYFECKIIPKNDLLFSGGYQGFNCTIECNSSWAWEFPKTINLKFGNNVNSFYKFLNISSDADTMKPIIEFKLSKTNNNFKIINHSAKIGINSLNFEFTNLTQNEIIKCDCKNKIITSSANMRRLNNFNKQFMEFVKGKNELEFIGETEYVNITYQNAVRLGGAIDW